MRMIFSIHILLISMCVSAIEHEAKDHTVPTVQNLTNSKLEEKLDGWLEKICAFTRSQAAIILEAVLPARVLSVKLGRSHSHTVRMLSDDGFVLDYSMRRCKRSESISAKDIREWLKEAEIYGLSNAQELLDTFEEIHKFALAPK